MDSSDSRHNRFDNRRSEGLVVPHFFCGSHDILLTAEMNQGTFPVIETVVLILLLSLREYWSLWKNDVEMFGVVRINS